MSTENTSEDNPTTSVQTLRQTFINHPDLFDLCVVFGRLDQTAGNEQFITLLSHAVDKGFTFTRNDLGYQLTIHTPED